MGSECRFPIKAVALRTGLTAHVIRVWEKRYKAVTPQRTPTNRRLYSEEDINRLVLLRRATGDGFSIGQVAHMPTKRLEELVGEQAVITRYQEAREASSQGENGGTRPHLDSCLAAVQSLDAHGLESALHRAAVSLSRPALVDQVVSPLMAQIGELWQAGSMRVAHEHMATAVVRSFLGSIERNIHTESPSPCIVVATPAGQSHELGALIAAIMAASEGWHVTYLGPSLPAEEIAGAALQKQARAVALSIIYPADDPRLGLELEKLRRYIPDDMALLVGGRGADGYAGTLDSIGAMRVHDMASFRAVLQGFRTGGPS